MTRVEMYEVIKGIVVASDCEDKVELVEFIDNQVGQINAKAEKARARAAAKKAEGDELAHVVKHCIDEDYADIDTILERVVAEGYEATRAKVAARAGQLVKLGYVEKEQLKGEDGKKKMHYRLIEVA